MALPAVLKQRHSNSSNSKDLTEGHSSGAWRQLSCGTQQASKHGASALGL